MTLSSSSLSLIEVEVKFRFSQHTLALFKQLHKSSGVKRFTDEYFDRHCSPTASSLAAADIWLRRRSAGVPNAGGDARWQCKVPRWMYEADRHAPPRNRRVEQYVELESRDDIQQLIHAKYGSGNAPPACKTACLVAFLKRYDVVRLGAFDTIRHSFVLPPFRVDFDLCPELDDYAVGEVEIVDNERATERELLAFCNEHSLDVSSPAPPGKVIVFLQRHHPELASEAIKSRE